jgi:hypothetical protein
MTSPQLTRNLVIAATLVNSILAGVGVNRVLVEMPAWQQIGPWAWAEFSAHADLSLTGTLLYALCAFAGALLSIGAVISFHRNRTIPGSAIIPLYAAALLTIAGLLVTIVAAPIMQSVPGLGNNTDALQQALNGFEFWGGIRAIFQVGAFAANLWSLVALLAPGTRPHSA